MATNYDNATKKNYLNRHPFLYYSYKMELNRNIIRDLDIFEQDIPTLGPFNANDISRGTCRYLKNLGYSSLTEFKLQSKRRVDVIGLNQAGKFLIIEIKSSVSDLKADKKWGEYIPFADEMYFAVANGFPLEIIPDECGIMIADAYNAAIVRQSPLRNLHKSRRQNQIKQFARTASDRLHQLKDPNIK